MDDMGVNLVPNGKPIFLPIRVLLIGCCVKKKSGLKQKTYCVEDNILVFVNIFSDVKFTFDCLF